MDKIEFKVGSERAPILIRLSEFKGKKLIDIRKFFKAKGKEDLSPTKKGISLTGQQIKLVLEILKIESSAIESFFAPTVNLNLNEDIIVQIDHTVGRRFEFSFDNGKTYVTLDKELNDMLGDENALLFINLLLVFHGALFDVLEDEDEVALILDSLNHRLKKVVC